MARISPMMLLPPLLFLGLAVMFFVGMNRSNPDALPSVLEGKSAPVLALEPLGEFPPLDDAALRAPGVKLVNFWASWCTACRVEHPTLIKLGKVVPLYGIDYKDDPAKGQAYLASNGNPYGKIGADLSGRAAIDYGVYGVPETFIIDANGTIRMRYAGPITERVMTETILPAIEEARANAR